RRAPTEVRVETALRDREAELPRRTWQIPLELGPRRRPADCLLELGLRNAGGRTDVEAHSDVGAQLLLYTGRQLRREAFRPAVVDGPERDAVVVGREHGVAERKDLETAGISEDRTVPPHECVQAAELGHQLLARAEMEVVRVPEHDLGAEPVE